MGALQHWIAAQKHVVVASWLGWTLDAFDFFLMVFVIKDVAAAFGVEKSTVAWATALTLAFRPVGAFALGRLADRFGRRPVLIADVALYSLLGFATAFSPSVTPSGQGAPPSIQRAMSATSAANSASRCRGIFGVGPWTI